MKHFATKAVAFYTISTICALTICAVVNVAIFWLFSAAGLLEFGSSPLFIVGLAITETSMAAWCVSMISEDVLYYSGEYDEEPTTEEKETL